MHVGQSDADDERRRWSDAAQIDEVHVQNLTEDLCIRSEAALPEASADNDLGSAPLWIARIERFAHQPDAENFERLRRNAESAQSLATIAWACQSSRFAGATAVQNTPREGFIERSITRRSAPA